MVDGPRPISQSSEAPAAIGQVAWFSSAIDKGRGPTPTVTCAKPTCTAIQPIPAAARLDRLQRIPVSYLQVVLIILRDARRLRLLRTTSIGKSCPCRHPTPRQRSGPKGVLNYPPRADRFQQRSCLPGNSEAAGS